MSGAHVVIINHWHDDNRGDSAITASTVELVKARYPGCSIRVIGLYSSRHGRYRAGFRHLQRAHPDVAVEGTALPALPTVKQESGIASETVNLALWAALQLPYLVGPVVGWYPRRVRRRLDGTDVVILNGGSNIYDDPSTTGVFSALRLLQPLYLAACAQHLGIPVVGLGHTIGAFQRGWIRRPAGAVLRRVARLAVRDDDSVKVCRTLGVDAVRGHDAAFALAPDHSARVAAVRDGLPRPDGRSLAVSVRQHPYLPAERTEAVSAAIGDAARVLLADGVIDQVIVVPHAVGPIAVEDDRTVSRRLADRLPSESTVHVDDDLTPEELAALYGTATVMVAVRLHAAILALVAGTPALTVSYFGTKAAGAMRSVGLDDSWLDYDAVGAADVADRVRRLATGEVAARLRTTIPTLRGQLHDEVRAWPDAG